MTREEGISKAIHEIYILWAKNGLTLGDIIRMAIDWADEHPKSPWISVEERLPEDGLYLARYEDGLAFSYYTSGKWTVECAAIYPGPKQMTPTHWMPIPELPNGGEK